MIGYNFFENKGFFWRIHQKAILPLTMPHINPGLKLHEARKLLKARGALLIRWNADFDSDNETKWWHIIKSEEESIQCLSAKVRNMVRRGAKNFDVRICDRSFILEHGYKVYSKAFARYKTFEERYSEERFKKSLSNLPDETEFWGVFERSTEVFVAFSENLVRDEACFYVTMWLDPEYMKRFSSYILFHEMNKYYLNKKKLRYVSDGARNISHQTGIHDFLVSRFGFRKAYSKLRVVYAPWLAPVVYGLYPFRAVIKKINQPVFQKISVLLEQERIRRACK